MSSYTNGVYSQPNIVPYGKSPLVMRGVLVLRKNHLPPPLKGNQKLNVIPKSSGPPEPRKKPGVPCFPWNPGWLIGILTMVNYNRSFRNLRVPLLPLKKNNRLKPTTWVEDDFFLGTKLQGFFVFFFYPKIVVESKGRRFHTTSGIPHQKKTALNLNWGDCEGRRLNILVS